MFWVIEWLYILWSDEVTFLIRSKLAKVRVSRSAEEGRYYENCIQHQFHRGHTTPISAWGAIRYNYKLPLIFIYRTSKKGAFKQVDYLAQVLQLSIRTILAAFRLICLLLAVPVEPLFMEDGNPAHGHKSYTNYCQRFRDL